MGQPGGGRKPKHTLDTLNHKGLMALGLGLVLLLLPWVVPRSQPTTVWLTLAQGLRWPGVVALVMGAVLLALHQLVKSAPAPKRNAQPPADASLLLSSRVKTPHHKEAAQERLRLRAMASKLAHNAAKERLFKTTLPPHVYASPLPRHLPPQQAQWSVAVLAVIEWQRFEAVCQTLFAQAGFRTRPQSLGADGGVDIWLFSEHKVGPAAVVRCKHGHGKSVGVNPLRELYAVMTADKVRRGTYVTTTGFNAEAREFAKHNGINLLDSAGLLELIGKRSTAQQQVLLAVAYEGEYWRPTCPVCDIKLVPRMSSKSRAQFWGCVHHPRCRARLPMHSVDKADLLLTT